MTRKAAQQSISTRFCIKCGTRLITRMFVLTRKDESTWAAVDMTERELDPPACVYADSDGRCQA